MKRYALRVGEALAVDGSAIRHDADGFYLMLGDAAPENEQHGSVVVVSVRGALCHYNGDGGDSYEGVIDRVGQAFAADPKPTSVVLRIESPGGVVAGLNECVRKLRRMSTAAKVPLVAFVDEMAASAAYALCCACTEILAPPEAIVGSIGVISTMVSMAARDAADGIEFRLITSGKRKADGHLHQPITDDAERAERERNAFLAGQFFELVSQARGVSPAKLEGLEAAIFVGPKAKKAGLIDDVSSLDEVLWGLGATILAGTTPAPNEGNVTDRRAEPDASHQFGLDASRHGMSPLDKFQGADPMGVKLSALIRTTEAAIASETNPKKLSALRANLAAFAVAKAALDGEDGDDGDDGDDGKDGKDGKDGEDGDDASKSEKAKAKADEAKRKAEAAKHRAKAAEHKSKAAEYEEAAKKCEESEEEAAVEEEETASSSTTDASGLVAFIESRTGLKGAAALGAAMGDFARLDALSKDVAKLKAKSDSDERSGLISKAKAYVPPNTLAAVKELPIEALRSFVAAATKGSPMVHTAEGDLLVPKDIKPGTEASLSKETLAMIEQAVNSCGLSDSKAFRSTLVEAHLKAHNDRLKDALNGAGRI